MSEPKHTPGPCDAMLGTIEKLMNAYARSCYLAISPDYSRENVKTCLGREFAAEYPSVLWHWEGDLIKVTGVKPTM
jgi:hypothetical protein